MRQTLMAGGSTFAHLLARDGIAGARAEKEDDNDDKKAATKAEKEEDEDEEDDKKKAEKKDEDEDDEEEDDGEKKAETSDDEEEASTRSRSRRAKSGDEDDEDDKKNAKASAARARERARCAAIFATKAAGRRPDVAAHLAFGTDLPRSAVINTLKAVAAGERREEVVQGQRPDLRSRMGAQPRYEVGTEEERPQRSGAETFAARVKLADEKRRGLA
jgi:hypothetical protein